MNSRNSGYGIFDPPVTAKMYKELKTEISSLAKQLQDLSENFVKLEKNDVEDLKSSLCELTKRIGKLENSQGQQSQNSRARPTPDHIETNKEFLQTLSWEQVNILVCVTRHCYIYCHM